MMTWVPGLNAWRRRRASTGGSNSARYCYSVWLRHLVILDKYGFRIKGARVGELGPGDSIGAGLAALLAGADSYVGLDIVPFLAFTNLESIFDELLQLYSLKHPIPDEKEFPGVRPRLQSYEFPDQLIDWTNFKTRASEIRDEIRGGMNRGRKLKYRAPWNSIGDISPNSLDLVFSQAALEYVVPLEGAYMAISKWLAAGGFSSHIIDFSASYVSPYWNGHWAYSDWEWRLVRGQREFFLNREPLSTHLAFARNFKLDLLHVDPEYTNMGLKKGSLSPRFRELNIQDLRTRVAMIVLHKKLYEP
jgi:hypothetical protein